MPTRHLISLVLVLAAVVYAAVSQGNGPAYLPGYALFSVMLVSWIHNRGNIQYLEVSIARTAHGFAGGILLLPFKLRNLRPRPKFGLTLETPGGGKATVGRLEGTVEGDISLPVGVRGRYQLEKVTVTTIFPLGVFRASMSRAITCDYYVYPEPKGDEAPPECAGHNTLQKTGRRIAGDDFAGVRTYLPGESQRHIDWKAVARGMPMMIKQFESMARDELWLEWDALPSLDSEGRLSQLAQWIILSERAGNRYGLKIPGLRIEPSQGDAHYHRCLRSLAVWRKSGISQT